MGVKKISYPEIRMGSEGDLVVQLQQLLAKTGSNVKTDGKFTIGTRAAVIKYQKENGLEPTGVCDKATWTKLMKVAKVKVVEPEGTSEKKAEPKKAELSLEEKVNILWEKYIADKNK